MSTTAATEGKGDDDNMAKVRKQRTEAEVRDEHLGNGALLLRFEVTRKGKAIPEPDLQKWRKVEKMGFRVTTTGCLIPHENYTSQSRSKTVACEVALKVFWGQARRGETTGTRNDFGWPMADQISHLCHNNSCCAYHCLELSPQWKNLKRNYCGFNGTCDCGLVPACRDRYYSSSADRERNSKVEYLRYNTPDLGQKVRGLFNCDTDDLKVGVKILQKGFYKDQDKKRANRLKRKRGQKKTEKETRKKAAKRQRRLIDSLDQ